MTSVCRWLCQACRAQLGVVRDGTLLPSVPGVAIDRRGAARVTCPGCGAVRTWEPRGVTVGVVS